MLTILKNVDGQFVETAPELSLADSLERSAIISLFSDRRAGAGEALPDGGTDRRGWWADAFAQPEADRIGSKLWLLAREKQTAAVLRRAREAGEEALAWLVEDGVAERVTVAAEFPRPGMLAITAEIARPDGDPVAFRALWEAV